MKVLFMGSPEFALPSLNALSKGHNIEILGVFTKPDRPAGRGRKLQASPVKLRAIELGLVIYQPDSLKSAATISTIQAHNSDLIIVVAYGLILPPEVLDLARLGSINVHASLLPRWRGAAPIQAAIHAGDPETGVTIMKMDPGLDTGPILSQRRLEILSSETGGDLSQRLAKLGADLLIETIPNYLSGKIRPIEQDDKMASYAPLLKKTDGRLDFMRSATELERQVKAFEPWPASFFEWGNRRIIVRKVDALDDNSLAPGTVGQTGNYPAIGAKPGTLLLQVVQPAGKTNMSADDFLRGADGLLGANLLFNQV